MFSMFSPDSKIMQVISRIADLVLLNFLFLITSLPLFTIGASITAMYDLCFRMLREEDNGVVKPYFRAFRASFRQATPVWLLLLAVILPGLYNIHRLHQAGGLLTCLIPLPVLILMTALLAAGYVFPWISQFRNPLSQSLANALILSISHLPRSLAILAINLLPVMLWIFYAELLRKVSFLFIAFYFAAAAFMNTGLLWHVFKPYRDSGNPSDQSSLA